MSAIVPETVQLRCVVQIHTYTRYIHTLHTYLGRYLSKYFPGYMLVYLGTRSTYVIYVPIYISRYRLQPLQKVERYVPCPAGGTFLRWLKA